MKKRWVHSYPQSAQERLRSDWVDAQADLSLRWAHTHFVGFVMSWLKSVVITVSCVLFFSILFSDYVILLYKLQQIQYLAFVHPLCLIGFRNKNNTFQGFQWRHGQHLDRTVYPLYPVTQEEKYVSEPPHDKTNKMACAPSEDSDQTGRIRVPRCSHEESLGP